MTNREFFQRVRPGERFPARAPRALPARRPRRELLRFFVLIGGLALAVLLVMDTSRLAFFANMPNGAAIVLSAPQELPSAPAPVVVASLPAMHSHGHREAFADIAPFFPAESASATQHAPALGTSTSRADASRPAGPFASARSALGALQASFAGAMQSSGEWIASLSGALSPASLRAWAKARMHEVADALDDLRWHAAGRLTFLEDALGLSGAAGATWLIVGTVAAFVFVLLLGMGGTIARTARDDRFVRAHAFRHAGVR